MKLKICQVCNKRFSIHDYRFKSAKTCSDRCRFKRHSLVMNGRSIGWVASNGYRYVIRNGKQVLEHREVVERFYKIKLRKDQAIHHKNHKRTDNRIENLEVMNKSDHARMHIQQVKPWKYHYAL